MIRLFALFLFFPFALQAACPSPLPPVMSRYHGGLLFKLEKCGQPISYLLGTLHADDADLLPGMPEIAPALKASQQVALEYVASPEDNRVAAEAMFLDPARHPGGLKTLLGEKTFTRLAAAVQAVAKMPEMVINRMKPWAVAVLVQYPPSRGDGVVLDKRIQTMATQQGKTVYGLETLTRQLAYFDKLSEKQQVAMAQDAAEHARETQESNARLLAAYRAKSLTRIDKLGQQALGEIKDPALRRFMSETLINDRNAAMFAAFQPRMAKAPQFIAVGALHLPGAKGLLARLEKAGYRITALP